MSWVSLFFNPEGRINRLHFWLGWLVLFGLGILIGWVPVFGHIALLLSLYCHVCVYSKRLHDMGRSGWWQLIPFLAMIILSIVGLILGGTAIFTHLHDFGAGEGWWVILQAFGWLALCIGSACLIGGLFLLWIGCSRGQTGDNRYGPPAAATLS